MQTTWKVTPADRDGQGKIRVDDEPRSLADLLPTPEAIKQDAKRQSWTRAELATLASVALIAVFILFYAWTTPAAPTPQIERATIMQPTTPPAPPTAAPTAAAPVRMLAAFDQPSGRVLGTIEETRAITPVAHFGGDWAQVDVAGSGLVWIRAADMPGLALIGPDLQPPPQPQVVYVNAPAPAPQVIYEAAPTPEPPPAARVVVIERPPMPQAAPAAAPIQWATSGPVRAEDFKEPNRAATCAFVGCLPGR